MRLTTEITKRFNVMDDPDNSWVEIKHLKADVLADIKAKYTTTKAVDGVMEFTFDAHGEKKEIAKACLVAWGAFFDESGRPLKFTPINVAKSGEFVLVVDSEKTSFYNWLFKCHAEMAEEVAEEEVVAEKN